MTDGRRRGPNARKLNRATDPKTTKAPGRKLGSKDKAPRKVATDVEEARARYFARFDALRERFREQPKEVREEILKLALAVIESGDLELAAAQVFDRLAALAELTATRADPGEPRAV